MNRLLTSMKQYPEIWLIRITLALVLLPLIIAGFVAFLVVDGLKRGYEIAAVIDDALSKII